MLGILAAFLLSLATTAASAETLPGPAVAGADTAYATALEALDRGRGDIAVKLLDDVIAHMSADAHAAMHEAQLRLAEAYLVSGSADSAEALIGRAWAELDLDSTVAFSDASDERLVQFIERVATAGRPDLALRLALLREARAGYPASSFPSRMDGFQLPDSTGLVLYVVSPSAHRVVLITLFAGSLRAAALAVSDSLAAHVAAAWTGLAGDVTPAAGLERLGDALARPLPIGFLRQARHLTIVPGGPLRVVPWDLLEATPGEPLIEAHDIAIASSATEALHQWSAPPRRQSIRMVGVGYAGRDRVSGATAVAQVRAMSRFAQRADVYLAGNATESAIRHADLRSASIVHLAVPLREGSSSGEVLQFVADDADDGVLTSTEAAGMKLGSALVVLADCPSRAEPALEGSVLPPVVESFQSAGASAVLWCARRQEGVAVDRFIRSFYEQLASGKGVAEAVQLAKLVRRDAGAAPAEWSAFVLYGDGRARIPLRQPAAPLVWWGVSAAAAGFLFWLSERRLRRA